MLYLAHTGILHVARRDRVSPDIVRGRVNNAIIQDHRPVGPHRLHTIAVNQIMVWLHENGITAYAGWRAIQDLWFTQLAPDLVFYADTVLGLGVYNVEVERTAQHPEQVGDKVAPWRVAANNGVEARVIFIVENPAVEPLFRYQGEGLPLLTSTIRDVRMGPLRGRIPRGGSRGSLWTCYDSIFGFPKVRTEFSACTGGEARQTCTREILESGGGVRNPSRLDGTYRGLLENSGSVVAKILESEGSHISAVPACFTAAKPDRCRPGSLYED